MALSLTFHTTPNMGIECGRELIVFRSVLAPRAGNTVITGNAYWENLPLEYHDGYNAWFLKSDDHGHVFSRLAEYFSPTDLRQRAEAMEQGLLIDKNYRSEDLIRLAEEIEKVI
jgi:hypothetical protein